VHVIGPWPSQVKEQSVGVELGCVAATAYSRLQFEDLQDAQRSQIKQALLRYRELDTLAMAMAMAMVMVMVVVVQGWQQVI